MQQKEKSSERKTIIFSSAWSKAFSEAMIGLRTKETGIPIGRLMEEAFIQAFGFCDDKLNHALLNYGAASASSTYLSLLPWFKKTGSGAMADFYLLVTKDRDVPLINDSILKNADAVQAAQSAPKGAESSAVVTRVFDLMDRDEASFAFSDFLYNYGNTINASPPVPVSEMAELLSRYYARRCEKQDAG